MRDEPTVAAGKLGCTLWTSAEGLHIRWISDGKPVLFSGSIELDKPAGAAARTYALGGGWVERIVDTTVQFSSTVREAVDGFDLGLTTGTAVKLFLNIDGQLADPRLIFVGSKGESPQGLPVRFVFRSEPGTTERPASSR